jgi:hypothetical protein
MRIGLGYGKATKNIPSIERDKKLINQILFKKGVMTIVE